MTRRFDLQAIRSALPIDRVVESYGVLLRRGRGACPICGTSERSTAFSARGHRWRCFACNEHGDVIDLLAKLDNLSLREAIRRSAQLAGVAPGAGPIRVGPRPKTASQLAREAKDQAWRYYLLAIRTREVVAAEYDHFLQRHGFDHPTSILAGYLLADSFDQEVFAEYSYDLTMEAE